MKMRIGFGFGFGRNIASYGEGFATPALLSLALAGCSSEGAPGLESLADVQQESLGTNALGTNALGTNALGTNALGTNALGTNALGTNALGTNGLDWLHEATTYNADRVQLLKYLVKCALGPAQYIAAHAAHAGCVGHPRYDGIYGLAKSWPTQGMTETQQRWVTACVLNHVNELGRPQAISLHGAYSTLASVPVERATMYASEGRYWGNIFRTELWKNVCKSSGMNSGVDSPQNLDILLGRSCPDTGCGVMTLDGFCPTAASESSQYNGWYNQDSISTTNGYNIYGWVYQPLTAGSTTPNSNGYFPAIEALSPVSLEFEGANGTLGQFPNGCFPSSAYNDGLASAAVSDISAGVGVPTISNCTTSARCAGGDGNSLSGQKLTGLPTGLRQRYSFLTTQPVGSTQFSLRVRYAASGTAVKARLRVNGSPVGGGNGTFTFPNTGSTDTYSLLTWVVPFTTAPAALLSSNCWQQAHLTGTPVAISFEVEAEPGATFPDLDSIRLEPIQ